MTYPDVQVSLEPPGLDEDDPEEPALRVWCAIVEPDDTARTGATLILLPDSTVDDEVIADGIVRSMLGAAAQRGVGLLGAVLDRMRREVP